MSREEIFYTYFPLLTETYNRNLFQVSWFQVYAAPHSFEVTFKIQPFFTNDTFKL